MNSGRRKHNSWKSSNSRRTKPLTRWAALHDPPRFLACWLLHYLKTWDVPDIGKEGDEPVTSEDDPRHGTARILLQLVGSHSWGEVSHRSFRHDDSYLSVMARLSNESGSISGLENAM